MFQWPGWLRRPPEEKPRKPIMFNSRQLAGGRVSMDKSQTWPTAWPVIMPPPDYEGHWRSYDLDAKTLSRISAHELMEILANLSPDVSRALWDFLRLFNPGWEAEALRPDTEEQDEAAQGALDEFIGRLHDQHGSFDVVIGRLSIGAFLRGALFSELVLNDAGNMPTDIATPDPHSARFRKIEDDERGEIWQIGQWQGTEWVPLDIETVRYVPIDPFPGSPYGRAPAAPALFTTLFTLGLLHDLRRVLSMQGLPRLDISVSLEALADNMPDDILADVDRWQAWVNAIIDEVQDVYEDLEPEDAYVHTDVVSVNNPVGASDSGTIGGIDPIIRMLERQAVRALKTMPLLLGINEATTETNAIRQWEIYAAGIKSIQHLAENMLERLFQLALEAQGIQADVEFRFAELRAAEMERDARTEKALIDNAAAKYAMGWISHEAASQEITGEAPDADAPRVPLQPPMPGALNRPVSDNDGRDLLAELRAARRDVARAIAESWNGRVTE